MFQFTAPQLRSHVFCAWNYDVDLRRFAFALCSQYTVCYRLVHHIHYYQQHIKTVKFLLLNIIIIKDLDHNIKVIKMRDYSNCSIYTHDNFYSTLHEQKHVTNSVSYSYTMLYITISDQPQISFNVNHCSIRHSTIRYWTFFKPRLYVC